MPLQQYLPAFVGEGDPQGLRALEVEVLHFHVVAGKAHILSRTQVNEVVGSNGQEGETTCSGPGRFPRRVQNASFRGTSFL